MAREKAAKDAAKRNMDDALAELKDLLKETSIRHNEAQGARSRASTQYYKLERKRNAAAAAVHNLTYDIDHRLRPPAAKADADLAQKSAQDSKARKELAAAKQAAGTALDARKKAEERKDAAASALSALPLSG